MIKKLLFIFALVTPCQGVEAPPKYLNAWGGLNVYSDSAKVADTDATALSNVLTDRGYLEKRTGSELFQTLLAGWSVLYMQEFVASSKTRYIIAHASSNVYASDTAAAFAVISTTTAGYNVDCTSAYGKEYCVDSVATPWGWNGTAVTRLSSAPICTFLEFADERLYCANTTAGDSRVHASAYGDPADWTVPATSPLPADVPNLFTFQRTDGEGITCFKVTPWGKFVGKRHSTHILKGQDNDSYYKRIIDPSIGCVDDRSVQMVDGVLMWLALEGVYAWAGSGKPELVSQDIDSEIKAARQLVSNKASWVQTSQSDWQLGVLNASGPGALVSETITPGSITPSSWTAIDTSSADFAGGVFDINVSSIVTDGDVTLRYEDFADLNYTANPVWTVVEGSGLDASSGYLQNLNYPGFVRADVSHGQIVGQWEFDFYRSTTADYSLFNFGRDPSDIQFGKGYGLQIRQSPSTVRLVRSYGGTISDSILCEFTAQPDSSWAYYKITRSSSGNFTVTTLSTGCSATDTTYTIGSFIQVLLSEKCGVDNIKNLFKSTGTYTSKWFDTGLSTPTGGPFVYGDYAPAGSTVTYSLRNSTDSAGGDNPSWTTVTSSVSGNYRYPSSKHYWQYKADLSTSYSTQTVVLSSVTLMARTTAEYYSDVKYVAYSPITWMTFDANESADGGSLSYWTRASTATFTKSSSTPTWVAQTNHLQVTASTGSYYQWKTLFNVPSGSNAVTINDVTTNWQEGSAGPVASLVWDHRYHLCVMNASDATINDRCWVYQRNKRWTHFDGPNYSVLTLFNNEPLAGSANTDGAIDKIMRPGVYSDKGVAIDAYWIGPDMTWEQPNHTKTLRNVWLDAQYLSGGTLDIGYAMNRGTVFTSTTTTLDSTSGYVSKRVENLVDGYATGRYIRLRFGNDTLDKYFRLNTFTIYGEVDPLISD